MTPYDDQIKASQDKERKIDALQTLIEIGELDRGLMVELRSQFLELTKRENEDERQA